MSNLLKIAETLLKYKMNTYYVGGCVRDKLMGVKNEDIDICIADAPDSLSVEIILQELLKKEIIQSITPVHGSFPIWIVNTDGINYEFAMARKEKCVGDEHIDFICDVNFVTIEEDLSRRDLTINSIAENVLTNEIVDPFNGVSDIQNKMARPTTKAFMEDPLRVIRAARFISRFNLRTCGILERYCEQLSPEKISKERVGLELMKVMKQAEKPSNFFRFLNAVGWLKYFFIELRNLQGVEQNPVHHPEGDAYEHTLLTIDEAKDWFTRTVMLCHDLGKVSTTTKDENGKISAVGHETAGVPLADALLKRIHFVDHKTIEQIKVLVELHMIRIKFNDSNNHEKLVRHSLRRLMKVKLPYDALVKVCQADCDGRHPIPKKKIDMGEDIAKKLLADGSMTPIVNGDMLIELGLLPSEELGQILKKALEFQDRGTLNKDNWHKVLYGAKLLKIKPMDSIKSASTKWFGAIPSFDELEVMQRKYPLRDTSHLTMKERIEYMWIREVVAPWAHNQGISINSNNDEEIAEKYLKEEYKKSLRQVNCTNVVSEEPLKESVIQTDYEKLECICKKLVEQLKINTKSLATYGRHPIIEQGNESVIAEFENYLNQK